jgi:chromosome segregation ATPase
MGGEAEQYLEARVLELSGDRTLAIQEWAAAEQRAGVAQADLERGREELRSLQADLEHGREELRSLQADLEHGRDEIRSLHAEVAANRGEIRSLRCRAEELVENLDDLRGTVDRAQGVLRATATGMGFPLADPDLLASVETLANVAIRLQDGNNRLIAELEAVNDHREKLTADLLAITLSRSWRVGRALTWPVRTLFRRGRRAPR